uniref:Uncharacterized protein n=1 Tax=Romanomermis culicivorax TaxID=13658 RepID=A0A915KLE9_ROMCU
MSAPLVIHLFDLHGNFPMQLAINRVPNIPLGCATAGCVGGGTMTTTAAACVAAVSKAGCFALTTSAGACGCVITCPVPPACAVWVIAGRFKGTLEINSLAE